jgi:predicted Zn-dependent peptidase
MRKAVMDMLHPENVEINITGDFDPLELEPLVLRYLGTVAPRSTPPVISTTSPQLVQPQTPQRVQWHLKDSDERACAYIAGQAPARWFSFGKGNPKAPVEAPIQLPRIAPPHLVAQANDVRRRHPLYPMVTLNLLTEIMNGRLFTTVRDSLGLTYDVNFEIQSFDRLGAGWFVVNVTSTPNKIQEAMDASLRVLRHMLTDKVTAREVLRARRTVLTRHETDLKVRFMRLLLHFLTMWCAYSCCLGC